MDPIQLCSRRLALRCEVFSRFQKNEIQLQNSIVKICSYIVENKQKWNLEATVFEKKHASKRCSRGPKEFFLANCERNCWLCHDKFRIRVTMVEGYRHQTHSLLKQGPQGMTYFWRKWYLNINVEIIVEFQVAK